MKNLLALLLTLTFTTATMLAQDPVKEIKNLAKDVSKYAKDPVVNANNISNAIAEINGLMANDAVMADVKTLISVGDALNSLADTEFKSKTLDATGSYRIVAPNAAIMAYNAYDAAAKVDPKKKDIHYGLQDSENLLNNFAIFAYQDKNYGEAFNNFAASIDAHKLLNDMGKESRLDDPALLKDQYFFTSVSAYYNEDFENAKPYLMKLYNDKVSDAFVYDALYNIYKESDEEQALTYLSEGRERNPDDTSLLFSEINHYLKVGELDKLIDKLKTAIEKEPDNISVYNTLGSVYDQLHQQAFKDGDEVKAEEYFDLAKDYYNQVKEKDPSNFDAIYSIGALYYNKAASYVDKLNELAADLSPAGMKAYDETKATMDALFKEALPYFEEADSINNQDRNTLIALKEIHARLNDLAKSEEYKARLEALGVTNQ